MLNSARPPVKRTYGSRKPAVASSSSLALSSPLQRIRSNLPSSSSSEWSDLVQENELSFSSSGLGSARPSSSDTPPTSPEPSRKIINKQNAPTRDLINDDAMDAGGVAGPSSARTMEEQKVLKGGAMAPGSASEGRKLAKKPKSSDLRSFFVRVSPLKKRIYVSSDSEEENKVPAKKTKFTSTLGRRFDSTTSSSSTSTTDTKPRLLSHPSKPKLEQLYLDPFETAGHSTLSCAVCSMSYARTPEDMELHAKHHKKVVQGCDWIAGDGKGVITVEDEIEWGKGNRGGRILMMDAVGEGALGKKIHDVLFTVDTELSATSLTATQLADSKLFLFLTPQRKVIACAVVQRISEAYKVVGSKSLDTNSPSPSPEVKNDFLMFGEDEGAIFCDPRPVEALLGVHRIWTSSSHRRSALATLLLDAVAQRFIYGCPISKDRRREDVAFSQPTGMGSALARRWTGTKGFKVFID